MNTAGSNLDRFLGGVRRRSVALYLLAGAFVAAAVNEIFRWTAIGGFVFWKLRVPVLDIGPLLFLILVPYLLRRWTPAATARLADARLGLDDRLTSFVDFRVRGDVPAEVRAAQERDAERALDGARPDAAVPIRRWLAAGPLLLAASILYPYLLFTTTETSTMMMTRRIAGVGRIAVDGAPETARESRQREGPAEPGRDGRGEEKAVSGEKAEEKQEPEAGKAPQARETAAEKKEEGGDTPGAPNQAKQEAPEPPRQPPGSPDAAEPEQLVSERVGSRLANVVDPLFSPGGGARPQGPAAEGTIEIDLVPRGRPGRGKGEAPGRTQAPDRVAVNLDALPEQYRPLVKTYFELLAEGGREGDTTTTRSGAP